MVKPKQEPGIDSDTSKMMKRLVIRKKKNSKVKGVEDNISSSPASMSRFNIPMSSCSNSITKAKRKRGNSSPTATRKQNNATATSKLPTLRHDHGF